jgi:hypothetical protein
MNLQNIENLNNVDSTRRTNSEPKTRSKRTKAEEKEDIVASSYGSVKEIVLPSSAKVQSVHPNMKLTEFDKMVRDLAALMRKGKRSWET